MEREADVLTVFEALKLRATAAGLMVEASRHEFHIHDQTGTVEYYQVATLYELRSWLDGFDYGRRVEKYGPKPDGNKGDATDVTPKA